MHALSLCVCLAGSLVYAAQCVIAAPMEDFIDNVTGEYAFIFHSNHNLLLVKHGDRCYYLTVRDDVNYLQLNDTFTRKFEEAVRKEIVDNSPDVIKATTHDAVRTAFEDLLADYHCRDKDVYVIVPSAPPATTGLSTTRGPHHGILGLFDILHVATGGIFDPFGLLG